MDDENTFERLTAWYTRQCNGLWEHQQGVSIESCDNPGWWVKVQLRGTALESVPFDRVAEGVDDQGSPRGARWLHCQVSDRVWQGAGDETTLQRLLNLFLDWAERHDS